MKLLVFLFILSLLSTARAEEKVFAETTEAGVASYWAEKDREDCKCNQPKDSTVLTVNKFKDRNLAEWFAKPDPKGNPPPVGIER